LYFSSQAVRTTRSSNSWPSRRLARLPSARSRTRTSSAFNGTMRDEVLRGQEFGSVLEQRGGDELPPVVRAQDPWLAVTREEAFELADHITSADRPGDAATRARRVSTPPRPRTAPQSLFVQKWTKCARC
jgi:hypothetical protein